MAIALTAAGSGRVEFGDIAAIAGVTAITVAITVKLSASTTSDRRFCGQWGASNAFLLSTQDTDEIGFISYGSTFYGVKTTATNMASGSQYRIVARIYGLGVSRGSDIWVNGSSVSVTPWLDFGDPVSLNNSTDVVYAGREVASGNNGEDGDYAEFAIWGAKLPDADCIAYGNGFSPDLLSRTGRILYAPMIRGTNDKWGGATGTLTGGSVASHPRVIYPRRKQVVVASAAAPAGDAVPQVWSQYRRRHAG